jgi:glycosyltransferase involved in cell wall biosynthesis
MTPERAQPRVLIISPALNEEGAIGGVVRAAKAALPGVAVLVIDDHSTDGTASVAAESGAQVLRLPVHLGLGGAVQAGYKLAFETGFDYVIRVDGDGQHDPADIPRILDALQSTGAEVVIGSRFVERGGAHTSIPRSVGIHFFRFLLFPILGKMIYDPTSGFVGVNRRALEVFANSFPLTYPEIEALVVLQRKRFRFHEIPTTMRRRRTGKSSITTFKSLEYMVHVLLGVFVNILRFDSAPKKSLDVKH